MPAPLLKGKRPRKVYNYSVRKAKRKFRVKVRAGMRPSVAGRAQMKSRVNPRIGSLAVMCVLAASFTLVNAQQRSGAAVAIDADDIGGVVTSDKGPEAGVWVIAETTDLPTKFAKVVVTDDLGRYVIPDLPKASYNVWVRGYGLVDSPKVKAAPGKNLNLTAVPAPTAAAAAEYYPGVYWYSMLQIPAKTEFPGTGQTGNGINAVMKTQPYWIDTVKNSCQSCHALGSKGIRTIPKEWGPPANWMNGGKRRLQAGQAKANMALTL